jgi:alanine dehydrogenase
MRVGVPREVKHGESRVALTPAAVASLSGALLDPAIASGATFISYNTVGRQRGESPILAPMSAIAGIAQTSRQSSHAEPIYVEEGVVHYCVPNMPAACPRTASLALERAVLPYVRKLMNHEMDDDLRSGIAVHEGRFTA